MMCEKVVDISKFYISWFYLVCHSYCIQNYPVFLGSFECSNVYFFTGRAIPFKYIRTVFFNKLDHSLLLVFVLDYHHCLYETF